MRDDWRLRLSREEIHFVPLWDRSHRLMRDVWGRRPICLGLLLLSRCELWRRDVGGLRRRSRLHMYMCRVALLQGVGRRRPPQRDRRLQGQGGAVC